MSADKTETAAALLLLQSLKTKNKKRKIWVRNWIARRYEEGLHSTLLRELLDEDTVSYKNFLRMSPEDYQYLLDKVTPLIRRQDTHLRKALTVHLTP